MGIHSRSVVRVAGTITAASQELSWWELDVTPELWINLRLSFIWDASVSRPNTSFSSGNILTNPVEYASVLCHQGEGKLGHSFTSSYLSLVSVARPSGLPGVQLGQFLWHCRKHLGREAERINSRGRKLPCSWTIFTEAADHLRVNSEVEHLTPTALQSILCMIQVYSCFFFLDAWW